MGPITILSPSRQNTRAADLKANIAVNLRAAAAVRSGVLAVTELFESFQGEGTRMGLPSFFVRLRYCDGTCVWCDTKYTWRKGGIGKQATVADVLSAIKKSSAPNVVITGGEPLLQRKSLATLLPQILSLPKSVEIETNGVHPPLAISGIQYNVSPKLTGARSNLSYDRRILNLYRTEDSWFKFVIARPEDFADAVALAGQHDLPPSRILFMPEGTTSKILHERMAWLVPLIRKNFPAGRITPRLHVELFGRARRGV